MIPSLCLALAFCAAAAPQDMPAQTGYTNSPTVVYQTSTPTGVSVQSAPAPRPQHDGPVRAWLRSVFGPRQQAAPCSQPRPVAQATVTTGYRPLSVTSQPSGYPAPVQQVLPGQPTSAEPPLMQPRQQNLPIQLMTEAGPEAAPAIQKLEIARKYEHQVGHEADYSWITGHLFYVHADGGRWVVRYALPGEIDKFGGSVVLAPGVEMKNFREGDLVCIMGEVLNEGRFSQSLGGALYRVNAITLVERADQ